MKEIQFVSKEELLAVAKRQDPELTQKGLLLANPLPDGYTVVPKDPKVSYNVGVVSGGTSVNSIPFEVSMEIDMRSKSPAELKKVDAQFQRIVAEAVVAVSAIACELGGHLEALDINPLICGPAGAVAVDALAVRRSG